MIDRTVSRLLQQRLAQSPAVTLVAPRQCGKTTLARTLARRAQVGDLTKATHLVLLCRVRKSVTTGRQWVVNLPDYLRATR